MEASLAIDPKSGNLSVGGFVISARVKPSELPDAFSLGPERPVLVLRKEVLCQFAAAEVMAQEGVVRIELRFETGVLVSYFLSFPREAPEEEHRLCSQWLGRQLGFGGALARYPWGSAGVATDRSGNSHIFVHNANNRWAN